MKVTDPFTHLPPLLIDTEAHTDTKWLTYDAGSGIVFTARLSSIVVAHCEPLELGPHPYATVTFVHPIVMPSVRALTREDVASAGGDLDVALVLGEWVEFCDAAMQAAETYVVEATEDEDAVVTIHAVQHCLRDTWAATDPDLIEVINRTDRRERLEEILASDVLDAAALTHVVRVAERMASASMVAGA